MCEGVAWSGCEIQVPTLSHGRQHLAMCAGFLCLKMMRRHCRSATAPAAACCLLSACSIHTLVSSTSTLDSGVGVSAISKAYYKVNKVVKIVKIC